MDLTKIQNLAAAAVSNGADHTKAQAGGGASEPPAAGPCRLRLVGYVETGKHEKEFKGVKKQSAQVELTFEVSGPKHPPREHDGKKFPHLIVIRESLSLNEKARFFKLAQLLNWQGKHKVVFAALGEGFRGEIIHRTYKKKDGTEGVAAELYNKATGSYTISPPRVEDPETGEYKALAIDPAITPLRLFLWDTPDLEQWASLFIEGEYEAQEAKEGKPARPARSKNVIQNKIKSAVNFPGSPIATLLLANGQKLDLPDSERPGDDDDDGSDGDAPFEPTNAAPAAAANTPDPLAGVGV
jgi:hypothetical protein